MSGQAGSRVDIMMHEKGGCLVGLKIVRLRTGSAEPMAEELCKRAGCWRNLQHPNVACFVGIDCNPTSILLEREWLPQGNIVDFLQNSPAGHKVKLILGMLSGAEYLDSQGIVHGNYKDSNILVDEGGIARITDWEFAVLFDAVNRTHAPALVSSDVPFGSIRWSAPERFMEELPPRASSDVYALCLVMLAIYAGKQPYQEVLAHTYIIHKVITGDLPARPPEVPDTVWPVIREGLRFKPEERPTVSQLLHYARKAFYLVSCPESWICPLSRNPVSPIDIPRRAARPPLPSSSIAMPPRCNLPYAPSTPEAHQAFSYAYSATSFQDTHNPSSTSTMRPSGNAVKLTGRGRIEQIQLSPNGMFMAASGVTSVCGLWQIQEPPILLHNLHEPAGRVLRLCWAHSSEQLLVLYSKRIVIWTISEQEQKQIARRLWTHEGSCTFQSAAWLPDGLAFVVVECTDVGSSILRIDVHSKIQRRFRFDHLTLLDIAVRPASEHVFAIGTVRQCPGGMRPRIARLERQIIGCNLEDDVRDGPVPIVNDARSIRISSRGHIVLVGSTDACPEMYRLTSGRNGDNGTRRITRGRMYGPPPEPNLLLGPCDFAGEDDCLVTSVTAEGGILLWNRRLGTIQLHARANEFGERVTALSCRVMEGCLTIVTGSSGGIIRMWTMEQSSFASVLPS